MNRRHQTIKVVLLLLVLIGFSFLKDLFTPDYLNSPAAGFLAPQNLEDSRLQTLATHWDFWLKSVLYSILFIGIPALVLGLMGEPKIARWVFIILSVVCVLLYVCVFIQSKALDIHLIPKINRYFHSPIFTLFLIAAVNIRNRPST